MTKLFAKLLHKKEKSEVAADTAAAQAALMARMNRVLHLDEPARNPG